MSEAAHIRQVLGDKARVVFISGNFNVLHPGHVRLIRFARELGDYVVVGVNPDNASGVGAPGEMRLEGVASNRHVEKAFLITGEIEDVLRDLRPSIVVKGREHENLENREYAALAEYGGELIFSSGEMLRLASSYFEDEGGRYKKSLLPETYMLRHGQTTASMIKLLGQFNGLRMLVIGDLIVDDYIDCDPLGMSQEDPTLVVSPRETRRFVGGAGIVAAHGRGLGAEVTFLSVVGEDEVARQAETILADYGVSTVLDRDHNRPTTLKQRFRASGKTLLRVSHLRQNAISIAHSTRLIKEVEARLSKTDLILFSDFNYGCLPNRVVSAITEMAAKASVITTADSQVSSQIGNIARFKGMHLITPTELETRVALNEQEQNVVVVSERLMRAAECAHMIMTLGADGVLIRGVGKSGLETDRIAALNNTPRDVSGAGDSLFCTASLAIAAGADVWTAALLGSVAAACQVGRIGNIPLTNVELKHFIETGQL